MYIGCEKGGKWYSFSRAAIIKYHRLDGLNSRSLFSHSARSSKVSAGLIFF